MFDHIIGVVPIPNYPNYGRRNLTCPKPEGLNGSIDSSRLGGKKVNPITLWNGSVLMQPMLIFPDQKFSKIVSGLGYTPDIAQINYTGNLLFLISCNVKHRC